MLKMNKKHVLAVDDDKDFLEIIEAKLGKKGFKITTANDGKEAVEKAKAVNPDLILMDVQMPGKDGISATLDLAADENTNKIPIIFLTSLGDENMSSLNRNFSKQVGAKDYFKKGGDYDILVGRINRLVGAAT